jgi:hypothetical protein
VRLIPEFSYALQQELIALLFYLILVITTILMNMFHVELFPKALSHLGWQLGYCVFISSLWNSAVIAYSSKGDR